VSQLDAMQKSSVGKCSGRPCLAVAFLDFERCSSCEYSEAASGRICSWAVRIVSCTWTDMRQCYRGCPPHRFAADAGAGPS